MKRAPRVAAAFSLALAAHIGAGGIGNASAGTGSEAAGRGDAAVGRALFERGEGVFADGGTASLQGRSEAYGRLVLTGAAAACVNCHGVQAQGGGEGGLRAPALRWPEWGSSSAELRAAMRERLRTALRDGRGGDGRALAALMPRFDLDERAIEALAAHLRAIVTGELPLTPPPRFALLRLTGAQALAIEREVDERLQKCLQSRLSRQVELVVVVIDAIGAVGSTLARLKMEADIVAVLAPPLRGEVIDATPPLLFPLVADPRPALREAAWLFGGPTARVAALLQAWVGGAGAGEPRDGPTPLGAWVDSATLGTQAPQALLERWADSVERDSGYRPRLSALAQPQAGDDGSGLWVDANRMPPEGTWLVASAVAASPPTRSRWWMAQPYTGWPPRPLADRWAAATCQTVVAAIATDPAVTRQRWPRVLASIGRQRDASGWDWLVRPEDRDGLGASDGWTVVEFVDGARARVVSPLVRVTAPREEPSR